jgi:hypothetical protein
MSSAVASGAVLMISSVAGFRTPCRPFEASTHFPSMNIRRLAASTRARSMRDLLLDRSL